MARDLDIEARLQRWADYVTVGDGSGYPAMSVLHPSWQPPAPGQAPTLKVAPSSDARQTHRAIGMLSQRLANTVAVHYCMRLPVAQQAQRLGCEERTVHQRIEHAHRELRRILLDLR
jgi:DNA-directed RNA polymerase specialized sigma24 family protein